jgi:hypothetical protein
MRNKDHPPAKREAMNLIGKFNEAIRSSTTVARAR